MWNGSWGENNNVTDYFGPYRTEGLMQKCFKGFWGLRFRLQERVQSQLLYNMSCLTLADEIA